MSDLDSKSKPALAPRVRLQTDAVSGDPVLLYPEGLLILNQTAHEIVLRFQDDASIEEIIRSLQTEYEVDEEVLRGDVLETLADLKQRNLIVLSP
ncbi:MAG: pyrroloquinoline quinone biosynthesis peptide chaperone PqqD [Methylacidiphilales bacterium]|nr:pyrroloquinoline quinone biosynthesis peptide chaperone PqqD [Candidatus Methylacidiphilales bacterium]